MKKLLLLLTTFGMSFTFASGDTEAKKADIEAGKVKSAVCAACHGVEGKGINPEWPKLAGQHEKYVAKQLHDFKSGVRKDPVMGAQASVLSDEDIINISAYFATIAPNYGVAGVIEDKEKTESLLKLGRDLYKGGDMKKGIAACTACHGPTGRGLGPSAYPSISGQYSKYTVNQLKSFRLGSNLNGQSSDVNIASLKYRDNDANKIMRDTANKLSDKEIEALSYYIQGLRP